ncbi:cyclic nucleotide-binding domain-containing protein [Variovorax dokdonensis]|uniref:Cyclic nucleotide-binding domain-containing protein n=1 Tax=Variovorax dokdonensis TaxID=344883 RepID=A0ABT7NDQ6_9BURK|nr:cyclic nucleotide-binding domain-containing protein [Variovorax dokdonensis]MDM0046082.1 cyclic nucleotide-binding domain-containing protein [Variovorax dokdonensis]
MQLPTVEHLQQMALFGGVGAGALHLLLDNARVVERQPTGFFLREGDTSGSFYVLLQGRAAVCRHWGNREVQLGVLSAGDVFGEMAPLDLRPRSASVQALEPSRAVEIGADRLLSLFESEPREFAIIQMNLARELSRRLRRIHDQLFGSTSEEERDLVQRILQRDVD